MKIQFYKYQGAGNDFILIDNRSSLFNHEQPQILVRLCHRRFGIGADGIMFLQNKPGYDFEMVYYNADGNPSSMCGNGGRCIVAFAWFLKIIDGETRFLAVDGSHYAKISDSGNWVSLQMIDVNRISRDGNAYILNTGSPHYVEIVDDLKHRNVHQDGRFIRNHATYRKDGININFVEPLNEGYFVRTYERGVEDETFACGTGVTAVALAMAQHHHQSGHIQTPVKVLGGDLHVHFEYDGNKFYNIFLEGPATLVFDGSFEI